VAALYQHTAGLSRTNLDGAGHDSHWVFVGVANLGIGFAHDKIGVFFRGNRIHTEGRSVLRSYNDANGTGKHLALLSAPYKPQSGFDFGLVSDVPMLPVLPTSTCYYHNRPPVTRFCLSLVATLCAWRRGSGIRYRPRHRSTSSIELEKSARWPGETKMGFTLSLEQNTWPTISSR
jgi:hypothetical protein